MSDRAIRTIDDMRAAVLKLPARTKNTLTALTTAAGMSSTVADWALRPEKRNSITWEPLLQLLTTAGHELVARPRGENSDLANVPIRNIQDLRRLIKSLPLITGKTLTALSRQAGISLTVVLWSNRSDRSVTLLPILTLLHEGGYSVFLRKSPETRRQARIEALKGSA